MKLIKNLLGGQVVNTFLQSVKSAICNVFVDVNRIDNAAAFGCNMFLPIEEICNLRLSNIDGITNDRVTNGVCEQTVKGD